MRTHASPWHTCPRRLMTFGYSSAELAVLRDALQLDVIGPTQTHVGHPYPTGPDHLSTCPSALKSRHGASRTEAPCHTYGKQADPCITMAPAWRPRKYYHSSFDWLDSLMPCPIHCLSRKALLTRRLHHSPVSGGPDKTHTRRGQAVPCVAMAHLS
jgi:hypothetical protein